MAAPKGTYGQPMQKAQRLMKDLTKQDDGLSQLAAVSQSPNLPNGTALAPKVAGDGRWLGTTIFTSSGTWVPNSKAYSIKVTIVGGGAGAGGTNGDTAVGGGGGSGEYAVGIFYKSQFKSIQTITIGAAGAAGSAAGGNGGNGGNTSFGSLMSANGASGGIGNTTSGSPTSSAGGAGGTGGTGGDFRIVGQAGSPGTNVANVTAITGAGASNPLGFGGGALNGTGNANGKSGTGYGSGGSGSKFFASTGGVGTAGIVIVEEYSK